LSKVILTSFASKFHKYHSSHTLVASLERAKELPISRDTTSKENIRKLILTSILDSYPGAIWPPSRWDGTHYSAILLFFFLVVPFSISYLTGYKSQITEKASNIFSHLSPKPFISKLFDKLRWRSRRGRGRGRGRGSGDETEGALQLEERLERGEGEETHVLGGDDDERTSMEDEVSRPLLNEGGGGARRARANSLPPGYDEAVREEELDTTDGRATREDGGHR
jgi:hypothetical protein